VTLREPLNLYHNFQNKFYHFEGGISDLYLDRPISINIFFAEIYIFDEIIFPKIIVSLIERSHIFKKRRKKKTYPGV